MKGIAKVQSPQKKLHDTAGQREAESQHLSVMPSGLKGSKGRTLNLHPQPTQGAVAFISDVSLGGRMRAIAHIQSRLAKLCSVGKRSDKSGYRCLIQPPAQYSVLPAARCQFAPFTEPAAEPSTHHKHLATYCRTGGRRTAWFSNERQSPAQLTQMIHPHIKPVSERTTCLKPILLHHFPAKRAPETNMLSAGPSPSF